jgi:hypothetical protein
MIGSRKEGEQRSHFFQGSNAIEETIPKEISAKVPSRKKKASSS